MTKLKLRETKFLHYGKYLYKLKLKNQLAIIFRNTSSKVTTLDYVNERLEYYNENLERKILPVIRRSRANVTVPLEDLSDATTIYQELILVNRSEFSLRCERDSLTIYGNNLFTLENIINKINTKIIELWKPDLRTIDFLSNNKNVIVVNSPTDYPYKVSFGNKPASPSFAEWIKHNRDKIKVGDVLMRNLQEGAKWINGQYVYVRDENIIMLLQLIIGGNICRIDKLVYKEDIDK